MLAEPPDDPGSGLIAWEMNAWCGYRCTYCPVEFADERARWAEDLPRFLQFFTLLEGRWELWLTGGEPLLHPDLPGAVRRLVEAGRTVSVETNLAATVADLCAVGDAAGEGAGTLSASLHLEYVDPDAFLARLLAVRPRWRGKVRATCVATRQTLFRLPALVTSFRAAGVPLLLQAQRVDGAAVSYSYDELAVVLQHGGHEGLGSLDWQTRGRLCWSGSRFVVIDHRGNAWRCHPARSQHTEAMGNVLDGSFSLGGEPTPCRYDRCHCAIPIQRGMVARQ